MKITILGSGPSGGVPAVGIGWGKCNPENPKNYRTRSSILIEVNDNKTNVSFDKAGNKSVISYFLTKK